MTNLTKQQKEDEVNHKHSFEYEEIEPNGKPEGTHIGVCKCGETQTVWMFTKQQQKEER